MAALVGRRVTLSGLMGRPALNGQCGQAESYNAESGRYNIRLDEGDMLALKPANVSAAGAAEQGEARGGKAWSLPAMPVLPVWLADGVAGLTMKHVAVGGTGILMSLFQFSLLNAALLVGLGCAVFRAVQSPGGLRAAAGQTAGRIASAVHRFTGHTVSPTQAAVLIISVAGQAAIRT